MATRKIKDAKDLETNERIFFKGHAKATYMSDGSTVEDAINNINIEAGPQGPQGEQGPKGEDGATFTPSVDTAGNLSWTNNGGLSNPPTVNIKGPKGDKGDSGSGGGSSSGGAYAQVNHGTADTTFTLTPNTFHVWDEVASLTLALGSEQSGVANEFVFQFTSGSTPTSLTLPDDIKWANDSAPTIAENMIYQISVLNGLATALEFNGGSALGGPILFYVNDIEYTALEGMTWERFINSDYADKSLFELRDGMAYYCIYLADDWGYIYYYGGDYFDIAYASGIIIPNRHYTAD